MMIFAGNIYLLVKSSSRLEGERLTISNLADSIFTGGLFSYLAALIRWPIGLLMILSGLGVLILWLWLLPN